MLRSFVVLTPIFLFLGACDGTDISDRPPGADADAGPGFDRTLAIEGLDGPVEAYFDDASVLHLRCQSDADCFAAQGYFHASHRFFQMDLRRRLARGRLSELAGGITVDNDHRWRTLMATRSGEPLIEQMWEGASPDTQAAIEAYTRGVNAWLDHLRSGEHGARAAAEYDFPVLTRRFDDWEPLDTVASFMPVIDGLTNRSANEIAIGEAVAALDPTTAGDLFGQIPASPSTIVGTATRASTAGPGLDAAHQRLQSHRELLRRAAAAAGPLRAPDHGGSNSWVVGPSRTADGDALLGNDPHLPLSNPAIWYLVHMDSKSAGGTLHVAGASFPGLPGVLFGHNESIAWGVTTAVFDHGDVYLETLNDDGTAVLFDGGEVPIVTVEHEIEIAGQTGPAVRTSRYVPHHGPILALDAEAGTALSMRWTAQDADTDLDMLTSIAAAGSVADAREAISKLTTVGQNFVVADTAGTIGWFPYNRLPERPWAGSTPPWLPLPGDGSAEWGAFLDYAELPQLVDPAAGFVATANNDMTGALADGDPSNDDQPAIQAHTAMGFRHERIVERLAERSDHDRASMQSIQADVRSLVGERMVPEVLEAAAEATLSPRAQKVADALAAWSFECPTGLASTAPDAPASSDADEVAAAIGCTAFHVAWGQLGIAVFGDELEAAGVSTPMRSDPLVLAFARPEALAQSYWDDVSTLVLVETRADVVAAALDAAGAWLEEELGPDPDAWLWGRIHTVTLRADLFDAAGVKDFNHGPFANDGGLSTVDVASPANPAGGDFHHPHGASLRLACSLGASSGVACTYELPGGQRHLAGDPHQSDLFDEWLVNEPTELVFDVAAAAAAAEESILLLP